MEAYQLFDNSVFELPMEIWGGVGCAQTWAAGIFLRCRPESAALGWLALAFRFLPCCHVHCLAVPGPSLHRSGAAQADARLETVLNASRAAVRCACCAEKPSGLGLCPLGILFLICSQIHSWLSLSPNNLVVSLLLAQGFNCRLWEWHASWVLPPGHTKQCWLWEWHATGCWPRGTEASRWPRGRASGSKLGLLTTAHGRGSVA